MKQPPKGTGKVILLLLIVVAVAWQDFSTRNIVSAIGEFLGDLNVLALILVALFYKRGATPRKGDIYRRDLLAGLIGLILTWIGIAWTYESFMPAIDGHIPRSEVDAWFLAPLVWTVLGSMILGVAIHNMSDQLRGRAKRNGKK